LTPELRQVLTTNRAEVMVELCRESGPPVFNTVTKAEELLRPAHAVAEAGIVALDVETTGLDALKDRPRLLQLALPDGSIYVIDLWAIGNIDALGKALGAVTVVGHNTKFDLGFLRRHYGIVVGQVRCTMTAARLIDAGVHRGREYEGYFSLVEVAARCLGVKLDKTLQTSDWSTALTADQLVYAANDVLHIFRLHDLLEQQLRDLQLMEVYQLECDLIPVVVDMYLAGLPIDPERWQGYLAAQRTALQELEHKLADKLPGVNPNSWQQLLPALRKLGCDVTSTSADVLAPYCNIPTVDHLLASRTAATFVRGLGAKVAHALALHGDNRVHVSFNPLGAPTGRMSCRDPNLLGMPKTHDVRQCIVPAVGYRFVSADFAAIELRVLAEETQDPLLLKVFRSGGDPHRTTAALLLNKPEGQVTKEERQCAKAVNFGFVFGMGAKTFVTYAYAQYGLKLSLADAQRFLTGYRAAYVGVAEWQRRIGRLRAPSIRTASGRLRRFADPDAGYCQRLNTPIQGTAADGMKKALVLLHQQLPRLGARLLLAVHDEVLVEAPAAVAEETKAVVISCMEEGMRTYVKSVPIVVEASVRTTWSAVDERNKIDRGYGHD
jgi:DNA polymerase-1